MYHKLFPIIIFIYLNLVLCGAQVIQFGKCPNVETMPYFDFEKFLGKWYEIERFPTWYTQYGNCAYQEYHYCDRRVEVEHVYVKNNIKFVLHVNSTYNPGDEAVFTVKENTVDPIGIPISILFTDYTNYAVVYGCKSKVEWDLKYLHAWILSREQTMSNETLLKAYRKLNSVPYANVAYLEKVSQDEIECTNYFWTAHIQSQNITDEIEKTDEARKLKQQTPYTLDRYAYQYDTGY